MQHLLYFAGYRMVVFRWHDGGFTGFAEFDPNEQGFNEFRNLLVREVKKPLRLLVDIIEEDFRIESIPHVYGKDREAVRQRAVNKHFRQYPHTQVIHQGREDTSRRDDIVLLSALTNHKLFKPWLAILNHQKIPLQGIYSLPLVGELLLKQLGATKGAALVISQQVPSNIRQSFYLNGHLKLSRLAPSRDDAASHYEVLSEETDRTIKFLQNQHFLEGGDKLEIYIIAHGNEHRLLAEVFHDDETKRYRIIDKDALAAEIGIKSVTPSRYCNWIYAHLLFQEKRIKPHYGTHEEKKYFYHYVANRAMVAASALIFLLAGLFGGASFVNANIHATKIPVLQNDIERYQQRYQNVIKEISELSLDVNDVKLAVDTVESIKQRYDHSPKPIMRFLSSILIRHRDVTLDKLQWVATYDANHTLGEKKQANTDPRNKANSFRQKSNSMAAGDGSILYEKILFDATVSNFNDNPRVAIEKVNKLVAGIKARKYIDSVEVLKMPFDIASDTRFTGKGLNTTASEKNNDAKFTLLIVKEKVQPL